MVLASNDKLFQYFFMKKGYSQNKYLYFIQLSDISRQVDGKRFLMGYQRRSEIDVS